MSAKKKGLIGAIIGAILGIAVIVIVGLDTISGATAAEYSTGQLFIMALGAIPAGAFYGFGFAFGLPLGKKWLCKIFGVAVGTSIIAIIFSNDRTQSFIKSFIILTFLFSFIVSISYLPGIVIGIKSIIQERKYAVEQAL